MNKLTIPAILVATVMVAGAFAFMPVEQASTVHTTTALGSVEVLELTDAAPAAADTYTVACDGDAVVLGITLLAAAEGADAGDEDITITAGGEAVAAIDDVDAGQNRVQQALDVAVDITAIGLDGGDDLVFTLAGTFAGDEDPTIKISLIRAGSTTCTFTETT